MNIKKTKELIMEIKNSRQRTLLTANPLGLVFSEYYFYLTVEFTNSSKHN